MKDRYDFRCVVYHANEENPGRKICGFTVKDPGAFIQFLYYCKEYEIWWYPREDDEEISEEYIKETSGIGALIDEINISYGGDNCVQLIEVWLT